MHHFDHAVYALNVRLHAPPEFKSCFISCLFNISQLEERWYRRQSWSIEHHEHQKDFRELTEKEFQSSVDERQTKVLKQRRWSQGK